MVLKDDKSQVYLGGFAFFVIGMGLVYFCYGLNAWIGVEFGAISALAGLVVVIFIKRVTITLDKATGRGDITSRGIVGGSESKGIELTRVRKLILRKSMTRTRRGRGYDYDLSFVMDAGEELPFRLGGVSPHVTGAQTILDAIAPDEKEKKDAQQIARFLCVPLICLAG